MMITSNKSHTFCKVVTSLSFKIKAVFVIIFLLSGFYSFSQEIPAVDTSSESYHVLIAGKQYKKGSLHNRLWGSHYRDEWATPVKVPVLHIDSVYGGLKPILQGGGRQTKTLRLQDAKGKQYVLRSINKTYTKALPEMFRGTFVESVANDQVSIAHPYSALTVPALAQAAKVFHTNPRIIYLADDASLGQYRKDFANQLYLFEERPAGFQGDAANFGNSEDVDGTDKMLKKIFEENDNRVDQEAFIRARLFDMFLSDWGRHEDQWRWATFKENGIKVYRPIPRDRDQAYTKFDGLFVSFGTKAAQLVYLQSVDYTIKDVKGFNFQARHLDRQLANEPSLETWIRIAKDLQQSLTDSIIERAIKYLPPEVYSYSGKEITDKLKSRRNHLVDFANEYYHILAKEVDIAGTQQREVFEITGLSGNEVKVEIYDVNNEGIKKSKPFYSRTFFANETREIRIYGLNGKDRYNVTGNTGDKIKIRIIGGFKEDTYTIAPSFTGNKIQVYDDPKNSFSSISNAKLHLSNDSAIHAFDYNAYKKDFRGLKPGISYNNEDRIYVQLDYRIQKQQWRKEPFGYQHDFIVNYSITQKAFSAQYKGIFNEAIGKWNLGLLADYDAVRDMHYPGIGNNTELLSDVRNYYRFRDREFNAGVSLFRTFGQHHTVSATGFYQWIKVLNDTNKYISDVHGASDPTAFKNDQFAGIRAEYTYETLNDKLFPTKGIRFTTGADFLQNLRDTKKQVAHLNGIFGFYIPIAPSLTLGIKTGAATLTGEPEFYQLNRLGGGPTLRGFLRYRFYGKTAVYNQNELQWNFNVKTYFLSGKMGLLALLDDGRVWQPGETSNKWHVGYGGGLMIAPFNKISFTGTYAISSDGGRLNVRVGRLL